MEAIDGLALLKKPFPDKKFFMEPLLFDGCLAMIFAPPGIGKTWLTLWLAAALAGGGEFLKWKANRPSKVFYLDSEMGLRSIRERFIQILEFAKFSMDSSHIKFLSPDSCEQLMVPNIAERKDQLTYERLFGDSEVIIIDNLGSASSPVGRETEEQVWMKINPWIVRLRNQGRAVVIVHHSGKGGAQLGTSRKEQPLDLSIKLIRPFDYQSRDGARFEIHFEKSRSMRGDEPDPISAQLKDYGSSMEWEWQPLAQFRKDRVMKLKEMGVREYDICSALCMSFFEVKKIIQENENNGKIEWPNLGEEI